MFGQTLVGLSIFVSYHKKLISFFLFSFRHFRSASKVACYSWEEQGPTEPKKICRVVCHCDTYIHTTVIHVCVRVCTYLSASKLSWLGFPNNTESSPHDRRTKRSQASFLPIYLPTYWSLDFIFASPPAALIIFHVQVKHRSSLDQREGKGRALSLSPLAQAVIAVSSFYYCISTQLELARVGQFGDCRQGRQDSGRLLH